MVKQGAQERRRRWASRYHGYRQDEEVQDGFGQRRMTSADRQPHHAPHHTPQQEVLVLKMPYENLNCDRSGKQLPAITPMRTSTRKTPQLSKIQLHTHHRLASQQEYTIEVDQREPELARPWFSRLKDLSPAPFLLAFCGHCPLPLTLSRFFSVTVALLLFLMEDTDPTCLFHRRLYSIVCTFGVVRIPYINMSTTIRLHRASPPPVRTPVLMN